MQTLDFLWAVPGRLATGSVPRNVQDVEHLKGRGIRAVLSLHPLPWSLREALAREGIAHRQEALEDHTAPSFVQMDDLRQTLEDWLAQDMPVFIHCYAGIGRCRTVAAAWLALTEGPETAMQMTRLPETRQQQEFVRQYARQNRK